MQVVQSPVGEMRSSTGSEYSVKALTLLQLPADVPNPCRGQRLTTAL